MWRFGIKKVTEETSPCHLISAGGVVDEDDVNADLDYFLPGYEMLLGPGEFPPDPACCGDNDRFNFPFFQVEFQVLDLSLIHISL